VAPSGVNASCDGLIPLSTLDRTDETAPSLKSTVNELTSWSPLVATHRNPVPEFVLPFPFEQLLKPMIDRSTDTDSTQDRMRIRLPRQALTLAVPSKATFNANSQQPIANS
jgi:hypothetical protein